MNNIKNNVNELFTQYVKLLGFVNSQDQIDLKLPKKKYYYNDSFVFNVGTYKTAHELYRKLICCFKLKTCLLYVENFFLTDKPFYVTVSMDGKCKLKVLDYYMYNYINKKTEGYIDKFIENNCSLIIDFLNSY